MTSRNPSLLILIDENIPYMRGRLERMADVRYVAQESFTPQNVAEADALVIRTRTRCNKELLEGSKVKLIATATIGTDHIDIPYCREKGIKVVNAPGCNAPGVAQYVWSSLLRLGFRPGRDRLGIVGCGNVGGIVAEWATKLGAEIMISDPPKGLMTSIEEILHNCDAITIHTPLTQEGACPTFHLIGEKELGLMKPGAILINAARGPVVDSQALEGVLRKGEIKAVIDTWEGEPDIDPALLELVSIATPHIAGYSRQGKERATRMALEAIGEFFNIKPDTSGLTGSYSTPASLSINNIVDSYDPYTDDCQLRAHPSSFESLRHDYNYREEVS